MRFFRELYAEAHRLDGTRPVTLVGVQGGCEIGMASSMWSASTATTGGTASRDSSNREQRRWRGSWTSCITHSASL